MAISKVTLNGETLMDVTGNTSGTDNMLYGTKGTAANGTSVTGTIVATPVDDTLSTSSHNAIENAAVATALASKADSSAIPDSTSDLTNDSNFVSDSSYVHTDNNFTTTLKNKLDGIATGATVDDHKWNDVALTKSTGTTSNNIYVPYMTSTSGTGANLATASTTPTAHYIAKYDANKRLYSTTPTAGDDSTKVATTAFVQSAISALGSVLNYKGTKSAVSGLPATGNTTGDVWIVTADSSEHVWNGSSWEQLGTTVDLSGYALASSIPDSTSDLTNDSGFLTSSDLPSWSQASTKPSYTASEVGAATSSHVHGNITNSGDITGNVTIASGDRLVINDESASKINNSSITFGSSTTTFLANNGTWQTPSGAVTSVNGSTGAVTVTVPSASTTAPSMDGTASYGSGTDYARANHVHPSDTTKVSKSGDTMTGNLTFNSTKGITFGAASYDTTLSFNGGNGSTVFGSFSTPARISGIQDPISDSEIANKQYVDSQVYRPNLIPNWYFIGDVSSGTDLGVFPVNQRGQTAYSTTGQQFTIDCWQKNSNVYVQLHSSGLALSRSASGSDNFNTYIHDAFRLARQTCTFSILVKGDANTAINLGYNDGGGNSYSPQYILDSTTQLIAMTFTIQTTPQEYLRLILRGYWPDTTSKIYVQAAKLELGSKSTLAHMENSTYIINEIPNFYSELDKCQKYLKKFISWSSTFAARTDTTNLYFFIPGGAMGGTPATLTSQGICFFTGSTYYVISDDITFTNRWDGVEGSLPKGNIPNNIGGSLVFTSDAVISAEA